MRRAPSVDALIPALYLKGISTGDFSEALAEILGEGASGLTSTNIVRLKVGWESDYKVWTQRDLSQKRYVYWWADGVYFNVRLDEERSCVLVLIGATEDGNKELLAVVDGYRESAQSWRELLGQLKRMGLSSAPKLAIGDGSLGFWVALEEEYGQVAQQRCWVHKTLNILDKMPKSVQGKAKQLIHEMYLSPTRKSALAAYDQFISSYQLKFPKACECLEKDKEVLFTFYDFPARALAAFTDHQPHRIHLCYRPTTNSPNKGLRFTNRDTDNGLQTRSGSPKALAPAPGLRTDPKGSYWRTFRRWRRTNPTGRLTNHFNKDAPVPDTQLLTISPHTAVQNNR